MSLTLPEYFNQERYFSESSGEMLDIEDMPFPHAAYAFTRLLKEHGNWFEGTHLYYAFRRYLVPSSRALAGMLEKHGKASILYAPSRKMLPNKKQARARLYSAGKIAGVKVTTHLHHKGGMWIEGSVKVPEVVIRNKRTGERIA